MGVCSSAVAVGVEAGLARHPREYLYSRQLCAVCVAYLAGTPHRSAAPPATGVLRFWRWARGTNQNKSRDDNKILFHDQKPEIYANTAVQNRSHLGNS